MNTDDIRHTKNIDLSVIVPVYNGAPYLRQAIDSVLAQKSHGIELLVVDDGSTDDTPDILAAYGAKITVITQPNRGLSTARNVGVAAARGRWLAFLDADDFWLPDFARRMLEAAAAPQCGILACSWIYVERDGRPIGPPKLPAHSRVTLVDLLQGNRFPPVAMLVRRDLVKRIGGFDPTIDGVQDWDLWLRLASEGHVIECIPDVLAAYRLTSGSMSRNVLLMRDNEFHVLDKYYAQTDLPDAAYALRDLAYGLVTLWAGAGHYEGGNAAAGMAEFINGLADHPALLHSRETYYAILCAEQALPFRGVTAVGLDFLTAEDRLQRILAGARARGGLTAAEEAQGLALGYHVLAELAAIRGDVALAARSELRSLSYRPSLRSLYNLLRVSARAMLRPHRGEEAPVLPTGA